MFTYALIFIAGSWGNSSPTSFSQQFYKEDTCIVARDKIRNEIKFKQLVECVKL